MELFPRPEATFRPNGSDLRHAVMPFDLIEIEVPLPDHEARLAGGIKVTGVAGMGRRGNIDRVAMTYRDRVRRYCGARCPCWPTA